LVTGRYGVGQSTQDFVLQAITEADLLWKKPIHTVENCLV